MSLNINEIKKTRYYRKRGYVLIDELVSSPGDSILLKTAYSLPDFYYIGESKIAYYLYNTYGVCDFYDLTGEHRLLKEKNNTEKVKDLLLYGDELIPLLEKSKVCSVGWSEQNQKWYGWSHRAIYGFGIGSVVKKGSAAFIPSTKEDFVDDLLNFWEINKNGSWRIGDSFKERLLDYKEIEKNGELGIQVKSEYQFFGRQKERDAEIQTQFEPYPEWGKGEWTAQTLEDAKQMAIDFAQGVG